MTKVRPYGSWDSPLTVVDLTERTVKLSQLRVEDQSTIWVEGRPAEGRNVLLKRNPLGMVEEVLPMIEGEFLPDVRTRVHEFGGKAYAINGTRIVFSHGKDDRVYLYDTARSQDGIVPLTDLSQHRYGDFEIAPVRDIVYAVCEDHTGEGPVRNYLVSIPLDGSGARDPKQIHTVFEGTDFVADPTLSPDGTKLAWMTWNHPNMPWTTSQLLVGALDFDGHVSGYVAIVDEPDVCVYEPRWTLTGDLVHVDDSSGWANLYRTEGFEWHKDEASDAWMHRLRTRHLHPSDKVFSRPHWELGLHTFDNLDEDHLVVSWCEEGYWHLGSMRLDNGQLERWDIGWWPIGNVAAANGRVALLADSPTQPDTIIEVNGTEVTVLRSCMYDDLDPQIVSNAEPVSFPTQDGQTAYGYYYPPRNRDFTGEDLEKPPLLVWVHAGPTSAARPGLRLDEQYYTSRGFALLEVNYRGSTGLGREYRGALNGHWGVMDASDAADGARFLIERGDVDPKRVAIRGSATGGFTAMCALINTDVFSAGVSLYGIADLKRMAEENHKFESHYLQRLVGSADFSDPVWEERSPVNHVDAIKVPLLLIQGAQDPIVPASQAEAMAQAHPDVEVHVYPHEGHGFRYADSMRDAVLKELDFYRRTWGIPRPHQS
ncbi:alpha/beta hydrolase family protein [Gleimia hominis]|uniref:alpha/beta hydrolase family protein n=1 Tax=Gleimia hominis TaxID=595468 RepID=UPI001E2B29AD|nr:alpha/beta fold hydrolase [Gleimia hominis]WIK65139.1 alpha/beta fold hydrolase [Gleimia hominis]